MRYVISITILLTIILSLMVLPSSAIYNEEGIPVETVAQGITVRGTFSAAAVAGLASSGTAAERTAKASEQTARNTKQLADAARNGGLAFA